jgi:hypothetical protein
LLVRRRRRLAQHPPSCRLARMAHRRPEQGRTKCCRNCATNAGVMERPGLTSIRGQRPKFRQGSRLLVPAYVSLRNAGCLLRPQRLPQESRGLEDGQRRPFLLILTLPKSTAAATLPPLSPIAPTCVQVWRATCRRFSKQ